MRCFALQLVPFALTALLAAAAAGQEPAQQPRVVLLAQMRAKAQETKVALADADKGVQLVKTPVFRYDDQPRRFIDATMWVWMDAGRPVALEKVEAKYNPETNVPQWGFCFTSVSPALVSAQWSDNRAYRSTEPGVTFSPLSEAPAVVEGSIQRRRQARELARKFSARILMDPNNNTTQEMRLLTTPIFEYADPQTKELQGTVFGFSTNGTNPDLLLLFEVRGEKDKPAWHFAPARMTSGGVTLKYRDAKVWEVPWVNWNEAPFPTWTFFATPRTPVPGEDAP